MAHQASILNLLAAFLKGLAAMSTADDAYPVLVIPGERRGYLQSINIDTLYPSATSNVSSVAGRTGFFFEANPSSICKAHENTLSCIALSRDGTKCATASNRGTLIRVFDTRTLTPLNELRRGMDRADIYSIAFNADATRLCVSSDKGTIHLFNLDPSVISHATSRPRGPTYGQVTMQPTPSPSNFGLTDSGNRGSSLGFMKEILPKYFSSEWSFAHTNIARESRCIIAFGKDGNTIYGKQERTRVYLVICAILAVCADGSYYKFSFDPSHGGEFTRDSFKRFLKLYNVPVNNGR